MAFLSTPSARRATDTFGCAEVTVQISIHALREEGDTRSRMKTAGFRAFLSTPSARRATNQKPSISLPFTIFLSTPSARRATKMLCEKGNLMQFLSTPSARRATRRKSLQTQRKTNFYPRPPRGGRPAEFLLDVLDVHISIHALREEGDALVRL